SAPILLGGEQLQQALMDRICGQLITDGRSD
ncbi:MAG: hypothetical protein ACI9OO_001632, partial [Bacteroidia bacterium]